MSLFTSSKKDLYTYYDFEARKNLEYSGVTLSNLRLEMSSTDKNKVCRPMIKGRQHYDLIDPATGKILEAGVSEAFALWPRYEVTDDEIKANLGKAIADFEFRVGTYEGHTGSPKWVSILFQDGTSLECRDEGHRLFGYKEKDIPSAE